MGFLTNLVDNFFKNLQSGLASEYERQAKKAGVHPIIAKSMHENALKNYKTEEKYFLTDLEFFKNNPEKLLEIKNNRFKYLVENWGSEENYELFKQKIEDQEKKDQIEESVKLEEYNKKIQKEKEEFLKKHNMK